MRCQRPAANGPLASATALEFALAAPLQSEDAKMRDFKGAVSTKCSTLPIDRQELTSARLTQTVQPDHPKSSGGARVAIQFNAFQLPRRHQACQCTAATEGTLAAQTQGDTL